MHHQSLVLAALFALSACRRAPPEPIDAGASPVRPWIIVTPANVCGRGVPVDFLRYKTGRGVEVWVDPNDPALDLKTITEGAKRR